MIYSVSFDDSLLCQYEVAFPVLKSLNLDAFFFIYTCFFLKNKLAWRYLGILDTIASNQLMMNFINIFDTVNQEYELEYHIHEKKFKKWIIYQLSFYTDNDKWYRYIRDHLLGEKKYFKLLRLLMKSKKIFHQKKF